jgi:hypothetical protein
MSVDLVHVSPDWLALREPADAAARAADLVSWVRPFVRNGVTVIHDLGCGTGSMGRWLAPKLAGPQHWVLHDHDVALLPLAAASTPTHSADGSPVTVETRTDDVTRLDRDALAGASLVTASALLDMLTADELDRLVQSCVAAHCPVLITLSVIGEVEIAPQESTDARVMAAFNAHQRRRVGDRRLLGPDAVTVAAEAFAELGALVVTRPSPWRLAADRVALTAEWFEGWVGAAYEQDPSLAADTVDYLQRRRAEASSGRLYVTVGHVDLLALPR